MSGVTEPAKDAPESGTWTNLTLAAAAQVVNARRTAASNAPAPNCVSILLRMSHAGSPLPSVLMPLRLAIAGLLARPTPGVMKLQVTTAPVPNCVGRPHLLAVAVPVGVVGQEVRGREQERKQESRQNPASI